MASEQLSELRIVLIGRVGAGKTGLMKTILRSSKDYKEPASESHLCVCSNTEKCHKEKVEIDNQEVVVVDTPGLCHSKKTDEEVMEEVKRGVSLASPGPHAFLFVLDKSKFTPQLQNMVELIWKTFGKNAGKYALVVYTHKRKLDDNGKTVADFISGHSQLEQFVSECGGRLIAIENTDRDSSQVKVLLNLIKDMVKKNNEEYYTNKMLQKCQSEAKGPETREEIRTNEANIDISNKIKQKIRLAVYSCALVGAAGGFVASYFVGDVIPLGAKELVIVGAAVGGVIGCVGIVAFEFIKAKICSI
ncbi:GTPase IMAP family member 9-like [Mastacembelus armatus]|uniref:GTPase IMAP family member 9-like n=1 Tax=Mastacembelus armatus TaxID=205130 RepID=UPI000E45AB40|nr:GTPase IMAP family member 9-like [Mastacembelus armatus]XP_026180699.1 GTPase IMAP family member 9-like [Mastacembelus armatus]XP_026180700.1 GTPase IMAP family member 9-like [Mastacembelus armatus]XP_026180701.1 GTPase IMAP family member 9-like [Mastacembelus armatus]